MLRASVGSTEASGGRLARVGRIDRSNFGSIDFGVVGPRHPPTLAVPRYSRSSSCLLPLGGLTSPASQSTADERRGHRSHLAILFSPSARERVRDPFADHPTLPRPRARSPSNPTHVTHFTCQGLTFQIDSLGRCWPVSTRSARDPGRAVRDYGTGETMSVTTRPEARPSFNDPRLNEDIRRLRAVDHATNLGFLAIEYSCLAVVIGGAIAFREWRRGSGLSWGWDVPVLALGIVLVGALQHRLAGLGHEAAHYSLLKNKFLNDLIGDVVCMFPILSTLHFYRLFHLAHHQYTNDPGRDPDLVTLGGSKMVERFPMPRWEFIKSFYLRAFTEPLAFLKYEQDYIDINVLGRSENVYLRRLPEPNRSGRAWPRLGAALGLIYLLAFIAGQWAITMAGRPDYLVYEGMVGTFLVLATSRALPGTAFFR